MRPQEVIDNNKFEIVAKKYCGRWTERALAVVHSLIVESQSISMVAERHEMTAAQAFMHRKRFLQYLAKNDSESIEEFMRKEKPKLTASPLEPHFEGMKTLRDKGYTFAQIVEYLKLNGISASEKTVRNFMKSKRA